MYLNDSAIHLICHYDLLKLFDSHYQTVQSQFEYLDWESFYSPKSHSSITDRTPAFDTKVHSIIYRHDLAWWKGVRWRGVGSREATR